LRLARARASGKFTAVQRAELADLEAVVPAVGPAVGPEADASETLVQEIRHCGRLPGRVRSTEPDQIAECSLAKRLAKARTHGRLTAEQEAELGVFADRALQPLQEVEAPPDPMDPFANVAGKRHEQDLLMMTHGLRSKPLLRRVQHYKRHVSAPLLQNRPLAQQYEDQILATASAASGLAMYVSGDDIAGDVLRVSKDQPLLSGPLVCQLCGADFVYEQVFASAPGEGARW
jgi:hypothetical protein